MKVRELIEKLKKLPPEATVVIFDDEMVRGGEVTEAKIVPDKEEHYYSGLSGSLVEIS